MKKKVIVSFEDGDLVFRGYHDENDEYFINLYSNMNAIKITRQYYPLKDNEKMIIWKK